MPKKISTNLKRQWLTEFEEGKAVVVIAKKYKNDPRTVMTGIDLARRLRKAETAQLEVLKSALLKHQESLMLTLDNLVKECRFPIANTELKRWLKEGEDFQSQAQDEIILNSTTDWVLDKEQESMIVPHLSVEDETTWPLLLEHLKQDDLLEKIKRMKDLYIESNAAQVRLQLKTASTIQTETGLKISDDKDCSSCVRSVTARFVWQQIFGEHGSKKMPEIIADTKSGRVMTDTGVELGVARGKENELKIDLFKVVDIIRASDELRAYSKLWNASKEAVSGVKILAEQLKSIGMLSGVCHICARLGIEG